MTPEDKLIEAVMDFADSKRMVNTYLERAGAAPKDLVESLIGSKGRLYQAARDFAKEARLQPWSGRCRTCGRRHGEGPDACSDASRCCRQCLWMGGVVVQACPDHEATGYICPKCRHGTPANAPCLYCPKKELPR